MSVVPSIIVFVITALLVFRREFTAPLAALLMRTSRQLQHPPRIYQLGRAQNHAKRRRACHQ
jgi:hypothetical protein